MFITTKYALVSTYDKTGLVELVSFLKAQNFVVVSTGKTGQHLQEQGISVLDITSLTQFEEILDGRVKTLNSRLFASLLWDRQKESHKKTMDDLHIPSIDLVVVNFYPFLEVSKNNDANDDELIENIDIGGPSMIRAAAKNYRHVTVLHSPEQYAEFIANYREQGRTSLSFRKYCAAEAFSYTCRYDQRIAEVFAQRFFAKKPSTLTLTAHFEKDLRYGENPHQKAKLYSFNASSSLNLAKAWSHTGKDLSYNNMLDATAAIVALRDLNDGQKSSVFSSVIIKHGIPCGAALSLEKCLAIKKAISSDEKSAFGGILALSAQFDESCLKALVDKFFEVIIAPGFTDNALKELIKRKNLRLLPLSNLLTASLDQENIRSILGGLLVQETDTIKNTGWTVVTKLEPNAKDMKAMDFAFRMVKSTPSNAITVASAHQLLGVGAGQPNRVLAAQIALSGAQDRGYDLKDAALASDAFFPFDDTLMLANNYGIKNIIQPGGSIRDEQIIKRADELNMCMVFTHRRHFRH